MIRRAASVPSAVTPKSHTSPTPASLRRHFGAHPSDTPVPTRETPYLTAALADRCFQDFVDEEEVGQQRAQVDRRVEVVDDLRTDGRKRQHEVDRRARVARIAIDYLDERPIRRNVNSCVIDDGEDEITQPGKRAAAPLQVLTDLIACGADVIGGKTLGGVRQEELVRLLDGIDALVEVGARGRAHTRSDGFAGVGVAPGTVQRLGSWYDRYCRRVIHPKIIPFVIHHFSGRTAK